ncbi:alpha/beta fold hydrolase, partial [Acidisphaera rubrifaciens]|uniref:alpha/beta fold hydrolase n=1 Tax=Acidisphaera rubrifaciens TaxID=50715 RepID=UPI0006625C43
EVILISGKGDDAADWSEVLDPADPVRGARYDLLLAGQGRLRRSASAVFPSVARFTRVCAYDRPGTRIGGHDTSTPVAQPHPLSQDVRDLSRLLTAAHEAGPYVLVANSYGGLIALLYARTHAGEIAGLVMVDGATERMREVLGPAKLARWDASNRVSSPAIPEAVELADAFETIGAAPPVPLCPAVVLSAGKPWPPAPPDPPGSARGDASATFADWQAAQDLLAASLKARHVTVPTSGHAMYLYEPQLVADAIRDTVREARRNASTAPGPR